MVVRRRRYGDGLVHPVLIGLIMLAVLVIAVSVRGAPAALAQGVAVGPDGIEVRRDPLAWQAGCRWQVGWADLRGVSGVYADPAP